jgi:uncharacterized protein
VLEELTDVRYRALATSSLTGHGLDELARFLVQALGIVRVYTKLPGRPSERVLPFTLRRGDTVLDVARLV